MSIGIYLQAKEWTGILGKPKNEKLPEKFYSESEEEEDESASTSSSGKCLESNLYFHCLENCIFRTVWYIKRKNKLQTKPELCINSVNWGENFTFTVLNKLAFDSFPRLKSWHAVFILLGVSYE